MTQKIELFFLKHNSQKWTIFQYDSRNWTLLSNMTHRNWTLLSNMTLTNIWLKDLDFFFMMTQRFSLIRLRESNLKKNHPENRTFSGNMFKELFCQYDSQNWTYCKTLLKEWNIWEYDSKNWTYDSKYDSKNWTIFSNMTQMTQRIEHFLWIRWKELNPFSKKSQRIEPFFHDSQNWTFFSVWLKELNFFSVWLKEWNPFFQHSAKSSPWLKGLNRIETDFQNILKENN